MAEPANCQETRQRTLLDQWTRRTGCNKGLLYRFASDRLMEGEMDTAQDMDLSWGVLKARAELFTQTNFAVMRVVSAGEASSIVAIDHWWTVSRANKRSLYRLTLYGTEDR
ncbi:hypothetical protein BaRGS_00031188, partial [Batillaria attramentaria]